MNAPALRTMLGLLLLAECAPRIARGQYREPLELDEIALSGRTPESIILLWPAFSYRLARRMISKYGLPADAGDHALIWRDNGPWKRTVVHRAPPGGGVLQRNRGRLEQSVAYKVPAAKLDALARFDKDLAADEKEGLLTARSDDESLNFLSLNLADEVLRGQRTPRDADAFRKNVLRLRDSGKTSRYLEGLLFYPGGRPMNPESPE